MRVKTAIQTGLRYHPFGNVMRKCRCRSLGITWKVVVLCLAMPASVNAVADLYGGGAANGLAQAFQLRDSDATATSVQDVKVFLLGGQSNMAGVGLNNDLPAPYNAPQAAVNFWNGAWVPTAPGFGNQSTQFGPEIMFARMLSNALQGADVRLVKYGVSGSNLAVQWNPATGPLYAAFRAKVNAALADLSARGLNYRVEGMIWMQGESDALNAAYADSYAANLSNLIATVRSEFGSPDMPFVMGRILPYFDSTPPGGNAIVRAAQVAVGTAHTNVTWFNTDTCQMASYNSGHYDAVGQLDLGGLFAHHMLQTMQHSDSRQLETPCNIRDKSFEATAVSESHNGTSSYWFDATGQAVFDPSDADFDGTTGGAADAGPGGTNAAGVLPDGGQVAFIYNKSSLSQTLDIFVRPGRTYQLEYSVGQWKKNNFLPFSPYRVRLLAGGQPIIDVSSTDIKGGSAPVPGTFHTIVLEGKADTSVHGVLRIVFESTEANSITFIDLVRLRVLPSCTVLSLR